MAEKQKIRSSEGLSSRKVFGYLMGIPPLTLLIGIFELSYINFFYDYLKLNGTLFVIGLVIYAFINSLNDPLIGHWSDNANVEKWGSRRIIFIKYFSPILVIAFAFMWFPWSYTDQIIIFIHFIISICTFDTLLNIVVMTWMALLPDMTMNLVERTKVNFIGAIIGLFLGFFVLVIPYIMDNLPVFQLVNIVVAVISFICYALVIKFSKERPEFQRDKSPPLLGALKQTVKSRSFMMYIGWNFMRGINGSIGLGYLFVYILILGGQNIVWYFIIIIVIGYGSNIFCMKIKDKYGIKKLMISFGILRIIGGFMTFIFILNPALEGFIWLGLIWTTFFGGTGIFFTILQTVPIDEDEVRYGSRREGMFYGINALFTKPAASLGPIIATFILTATFYVTGGSRDAQPESAIIGIKCLFFLVPQIFSILALVFIYFYPVDREILKQLEINLETLHQQKRERLANEKFKKI